MSHLIRLVRIGLVGIGMVLFAAAMSGPGVQALAPDVPIRSGPVATAVLPSQAGGPVSGPRLPGQPVPAPFPADPARPMVPLEDLATAPEPASAGFVPLAAPQPPRRIVVPATGIDAEIRTARIRNGEWEIPPFAVGHWDASPTPSQPGNGIYYGHVESIRDGEPFATLPRARAGMLVYIDTDELRFVYEIVDVEVVSRFATDVLLPSADTRITLITCTGTFIPAERDYTHRFIARAVLAWSELLPE